MVRDPGLDGLLTQETKSGVGIRVSFTFRVSPLQRTGSGASTIHRLVFTFGSRRPRS